jgi:hypothetical protein
MLKIILLLSILLVSSPTWSQAGNSRCDRELLAEVFGHAQKVTFEGLAREPGHEWNELALTCKDRPGHRNRVIVATFFEPSTPPADFQTKDIQFVLAVVDQAQRRLLSLHTSKFEQDGGANAFGTGSLTIDTARYDLKKGVRAIGVRMDVVRPGCAWEGTSSDALWLFVEQGPVLQPVLSGMGMFHSWRQFFKGCICCFQEESRGAVHDASLTLSLAPTSSNGYRDRALRADLSSTEYNLPPNEIRSETVFLGLLKFDGQQYRKEGLGRTLDELLEARMQRYEKWR